MYLVLGHGANKEAEVEFDIQPVSLQTEITFFPATLYYTKKIFFKIF